MKLHGGSRGSLWQNSLSHSSDTQPNSLPIPSAGQGRSSWSRGRAHLRSSLRWPCLFLALAFICSLSHLSSSLSDCVSKQILSQRIALKPNDALVCSIPLRGQAKGGWSCPQYMSGFDFWGGVGYLEQGRGFSAAQLDAVKKKDLNLLLIWKKEIKQGGREARRELLYFFKGTSLCQPLCWAVHAIRCSAPSFSVILNSRWPSRQ